MKPNSWFSIQQTNINMLFIYKQIYKLTILCQFCLEQMSILICSQCTNKFTSSSKQLVFYTTKEHQYALHIQINLQVDHPMPVLFTTNEHDICSPCTNKFTSSSFNATFTTCLPCWSTSKHRKRNNAKLIYNKHCQIDLLKGTTSLALMHLSRAIRKKWVLHAILQQLSKPLSHRQQYPVLGTLLYYISKQFKYNTISISLMILCIHSFYAYICNQ